MIVTRQISAAVAVALVALMALVPAVGACCAGRPVSAMAAMHAQMPCCAQTCKLMKDNVRTERDYALTAATATPLAPAAVAVITTVPSATTADATVQPVAFASPPSFLSHHQFRI